MTKLISIISLAIIITMCLFGSMPADAIDGKPVVQKDNKVQLNFKMEAQR